MDQLKTCLCTAIFIVLFNKAVTVADGIPVSLINDKQAPLVATRVQEEFLVIMKLVSLNILYINKIQVFLIQALVRVELPDNIDTRKFVQRVYSQNMGLADHNGTGKLEHGVQKQK